jgi:hypothetical protein
LNDPSSEVAPTTKSQTIIERTKPWTAEVYARIQRDELIAAMADAFASRDTIRRKPTPRAPRENDPPGFVPAELRFTRYAFGKKSPIRTEAQWRRNAWVQLSALLDAIPKGAPEPSDSSPDDGVPDSVTPMSELQRKQAVLKHRDLLNIARLLGELTQEEISHRTGLTPRQVQLRVAKINNLISKR